MAQLVGLIVSEDDAFKKHFGRLLRAGAIPVSVIDERGARYTPPDLVIVDTRGDASSSMSSTERLRLVGLTPASLPSRRRPIRSDPPVDAPEPTSSSRGRPTRKPSTKKCAGRRPGGKRHKARVGDDPCSLAQGRRLAPRRCR
jgi:hypothetical protein